MVTNRQYRRLMKLIQEEQTLATAAAKAGMDEKTARKYRDLAKLPSQLKPERTWRTRKDAFEDVWSEVVAILERDEAVESKTVFEYLCRQHPGRFQEGELRSMQRRIKVWRARYGSAKEVMFVQHHLPGRQSQSDFTYMNSVGVRIAGQLFDHLLYHFTLTYSNWESVMVCFSESFESLSAGLQNALWEVGAVPEDHRTDSLTAAVNNLKEEEEFTERYQGLMRHYGMRPSHNNPGRGHENGDVEQAHYRFKKAVEQELILRGSREFQSRAHYEAFLRETQSRRNGGRQERLQDELSVMRRLPERRTEDWSRWRGKVTAFSTVNVKNNIYSVDSRLIGECIDVRAYAEVLEVWHGGQFIERIPRLRGSGRHHIQYRHIIDSLVRKPGAFANYRYQSDLFPGVLFRVAYDYLREHDAAGADRQYVRILHVAAQESEQRVDEALRYLVERGEAITAERVSEWVKSPVVFDCRHIEIDPVEIAVYDSLLEGTEEVCA
jgi:transposase